MLLHRLLFPSRTVRCWSSLGQADGCLEGRSAMASHVANRVALMDKLATSRDLAQAERVGR